MPPGSLRVVATWPWRRVMRQMTCPPQSPDLNPTEMVWDQWTAEQIQKGQQALIISGVSSNTIAKPFSDYLLKFIDGIPSARKAVMKEKGA